MISQFNSIPCDECRLKDICKHVENLKNDQCTGCAHAMMCKYISAYDREINAYAMMCKYISAYEREINALNEHISDCRYILDELPKDFRISVYCPLFHPKNSAVPRGFAK